MGGKSLDKYSSNQMAKVRSKFKTYKPVLDIADSIVDKIPNINSIRRSYSIVFKCAIYAFRTIEKERLSDLIKEFDHIKNTSELDEKIEVYINRKYIVTLKSILNDIETHYNIRLIREEALILAMMNLQDISEEDFLGLLKGVQQAQMNEEFRVAMLSR